MSKSNHFNPFAYVETSSDITDLANVLVDGAGEGAAKGEDQFWSDTTKLLLTALIGYMVETLPKDNQTLSSLMNLLLSTTNVAGERPTISLDTLDDLFNDLENKSLAENNGEPNKSWVVTQYKLFKQAAGKTVSAIIVSAASRLQPLTLNAIKDLTAADDMELDKLGDEKTALFVAIPTGMCAFNYLATILYTQLLRKSYCYAQNEAEYSQCIIDKEKNIWKTFRADLNSVNRVKKQAETYMECIRDHATIRENPQMHWWEIRMDYLGDDVLVGFRGTKEEASHALASLKTGRVMPNSEQTHDGSRMPIHLTLVMDEITCTGRIPCFAEYMAVIRRYDISAMLFVQSVTQIKKLYPEEWEGIAGNCDTLIGLGGGADAETFNWFAQFLDEKPRLRREKDRRAADIEKLYEYREMNEDTCIVVVKSIGAFKDKKFSASEHKQAEAVNQLNASGRYTFDAEKAVTN